MKVTVSRRQFLKGAGALIVAFNILPPRADVFGQASSAAGDLDPEALDSWLAVAPDGTVTIFTSKVELGTGMETALAQIAAEELEVSWRRVKVVMGDTARTVDQSATGGSRTIERAGPQIRQAAAAAHKELLRLAAAKLRVAPDTLYVKDGVVGARGTPGKTVSYAQLIGGKRFQCQDTCARRGGRAQAGPGRKSEKRRPISNGGRARAALRLAA
jgi:CO/xanthine dehydrogenase Mo-binding subunit